MYNDGLYYSEGSKEVIKMTRSIFIGCFIFVLGGWYLAENKRKALESKVNSLEQYKHDADSVNEANKVFLDTLNKVLHKDHRYKNWMVK